MIAEVDEDISPLQNWGNVPLGDVTIVTGPRWPNLLQLFVDSENLQSQRGAPGLGLIWARGFPLDHISHFQAINFGKSVPAEKIWIWQNWTSGAPDIDAICRLTLDPSPNFINRSPIALEGALAPFNSQNTIGHVLKPWLSLICHPMFHSGILIFSSRT